MSAGVDLSQFFETFFDEADELLSDMEQSLLELDIDQPDIDQLNAIFRAAHSIKGGAGTFGCFGHLADTTHLLENLLDAIRRGEMPLRKDMIDLFLETKDVLTEQVAAYRNSQDPDVDAYERICAQLRELALEQSGDAPAEPQVAQPVTAPAPAQPEPPVAAVDPAPVAAPAATGPLCVRLKRLNAKDAEALAAEMALLGQVLHQEPGADSLSIWLDTTATADDLQAVCCFIVSEDQVQITHEPVPATASAPASSQPVQPAEPVQAPAAEVPAAPAPVAAAPEPTPAPAKAAAAAKTESKGAASASNSTIRVGVEKVDQIINLVGELVITQAMLVQRSSSLDPVLHDRLLNGIEQLERNARDLQEAVMSIRMMPMDYVFSRFPRVVRENASKMGKSIKLTTHGQATELDKSLIERIIDPLTHLVRNSIDHGIETPEARIAAGKNPEGNMVLSAQHHGGQIVIEVSDDGAGLNRDRILKKALAQGMAVTENTPDEELWQLIFAPGFSTAEKVTDISGRGVGMDVVRRNIQAMGGHIQLSSRTGQGTTTRIILPLTLAILDGMSVRVGAETFILPLSHVTESMQPSRDQIRSISETEHVLHVRGEYLPLVALHSVFSVDEAETDITRSIAVILQAEDVRFALLVDHLIGQHQVVVKNLESNYRKIPGVSAATILGDGSVALIVDVFALMRVTRERATI
ncbi:chemotaxis protein CheA [Pollutimonas thiosulfatoxidans]|uniref:Chemotaxis protein CheA n=1 Tax=Pollutimonas thiosulfatoxidans TaxID=2028345 RepID=A0A410G9B8_9BURK|nr:chemotaxis protein CheA [Pollutimonas thiosulfatoxidans]QAA92914.1 chemotaxis protein CheA [Pollutimonas thiosulfatoxidans]